MVKETETEVETPKVPRKPVAEHILLAADGSEAESEEKATGIRYKLLENNKALDWQWAEANEAERTMFGIFGAKTLATNVTSAARNGKVPATADEQFDELTARFALIRGGQWVSKDREGGPRVDKDALAFAIVQVMIANRKVEPNAVDATIAEKRARLESDSAYMAHVRTNPDVATAYNAKVGKKTATADDL